MISNRMKSSVSAVLLLAGLLWTSGSASAQMRCLPSCATNDARFLAISGSNLINLSENKLNLAISVPAGSTSFQIGIFDGDANGLDGSGVSHWDTGVTGLYNFTLYADPAANSTGTTVVEMASGFPFISSTSMPDNAWADFTIPTSPDALTPSGNYFYRLNIQLLTPTLTTTNAFKVRTTAVLSGVTLDPVAQPFSYIANLRGLADLNIVYPTYPSATPTNYSGEFRFFFDVPVAQDELSIWDGDFDRGKFDGTELDTDDPDTPNAPFLPSWATPSAVSEGVAVGTTGTTGNPADDRNPSGAGIYNSKPPSVQYQVLFPDGQVFLNSNPSGNSEWEQFRIATGSFDASLMDYNTSTIPPGVYELRTIGVDMQNLNALRLPFRLLCIEETGVPCTPLRPYKVGDTVFYDPNGNGVQDAGEAGIPGIVLNLFDHAGNLLASTTTDADGKYSFPAEAYTYTVSIASANFHAGGPLDGFISTTGNQRIETVVNDNVLTYDFGYRGTASIGDRVWIDANGDEIQDTGELGLDGITVELLDGAGNVLATTVTDTDGLYLFDSLAGGSYGVRVVSSTLQAGLAQTYDLDGTGTAHTATVALAPGQDRTDVDFGYRGTGSLGDRVWEDLDAAGVQDAGETGLNGVTLELVDGAGNIVATTTASGDGGYSFQHLRPGTYTVRVVSSTLPADYVQTYDLDGTSSPHQATVSLGAGEARVDLDFGYRTPPTASLGDRVWNDLDGNGIQEAGEDGVNGVTVQLLNASDTVVATQVTSGNGNYSFINLPAGTYTVRVVSSTLPANFIQTYDLDGTGTAHTATVSLAPGDARTDVDFGYRADPAFQPGTGTIGYWKTHPEAWPVQQITIGGVTYTKTQAISWMDTPSRGDKTIDLFKQLVAAKLNVIIGNDASCVSSSMFAADSWLATNPLGSNVRSNSAAWLTGGPLHQRLDDYNNGKLCAPHRG